MKVRRLQVLVLEVFRSGNKRNLFTCKVYLKKNVESKTYKDDVKVPIRNSVTFGNKSIRVLGHHIWNVLPAELKRETSYRKFKTQIDNCFGPTYM